MSRDGTLRVRVTESSRGEGAGEVTGVVRSLMLWGRSQVRS